LKRVPPVGGAPSRHTGTGGAADGVHDQYRLRDSGAGDRSRVVPRSKQLGKQPDEARCRADQAARQAARRGDVEQPRRCAGRQAGAHTQEGRRQPPNKTNGSYDKASASCGRLLGTVFETQGSPSPFVWQIYLGRLLYKRTGPAAEAPLKLACSPSHKQAGGQSGAPSSGSRLWFPGYPPVDLRSPLQGARGCRCRGRSWQIGDFTSKADVLVDRLREPGLSEVECNIPLPRRHFAIRSWIGGVVHVVVAADLSSLDTSGLGHICTMSCLVKIGVRCGIVARAKLCAALFLWICFVNCRAASQTAKRSPVPA
jgi:hypothetical protein